MTICNKSPSHDSLISEAQINGQLGDILQLNRLSRICNSSFKSLKFRPITRFDALSLDICTTEDSRPKGWPISFIRIVPLETKAYTLEISFPYLSDKSKP